MLTIERIKEIVAELVSTCPTAMEYEIINHLMQGVIFHGKMLRTSFMQEILSSAQDTMYRMAL